MRGSLLSVKSLKWQPLVASALGAKDVSILRKYTSDTLGVYFLMYSLISKDPTLNNG